MKRIFHIVCLPAMVVLSLWAGHGVTCRAAQVRDAVWAGKFYPADSVELTRTIRRLTEQAQRTPITLPDGKTLKALILPHAGYVYSGRTAAHAARVLTEGRFSKIILIGPDHRVGFENAAVSDADAWRTPLGTVPLHPDAALLRSRSLRFRAVPASDRAEHCLEVLLPFLQVYLKQFSLVPVVMGRPGNLTTLAADIDAIRDPETLLVISSDLSHYLTYDAAVVRDTNTIETIRHMQMEKLAERENCACGKAPILITLHLARLYGWQPVLLDYTNSGDTAGSKDRVVGYAAIAFYGDTMNDTQHSTGTLGTAHGQVLLRLARRTIAGRLGLNPPALSDADRALLDASCLADRRGTFVTLTIEGNLRGCIGSLTGTDPVADGVRRNAVNAAFNDPRFPPLSAEEMERVAVEVSILTEPRPLAFQDGDDLAARLRPNIDGVIIQKGRARATFLPQVWQQLPDPESFLSHLCMKAGLSADAWRKPGLEVLTYQVQYFEEHR